MRYLLDTNVLIWSHVDERRLSREHRRALERAMRIREPIAISAMTLWELALLLRDGRVRDRGEVAELFEGIEDNEAIVVLPFGAAIAREAASFPREFPKDPADRLIAATARTHDLVLLTGDGRIRASGVVKVL